jgi:regulator of sigma E protease
MLGITIISVIILLGVLIFVHELGHFLMAKTMGVGIQKFSLGFGPKLIGKKIGETEYRLSLIPLGGYVKLLGESENETLSPEEEKRSFLKQPLYKKISIVASGPVFNFILAIFIFTVVYIAGIPVWGTKIGGILAESPASLAGLQRGDVVKTIDQKNISRWEEISETVSKSHGKRLKISIERNRQLLDFAIIPRLTKVKNLFGESVEDYKLGISPAEKLIIVRLNPISALMASLQRTWFISKLTLISIVKIFEGVVSPKSLGGPILIAQIAGTQVKEGLIPFLLFMALLSINLGILNLLPIPVLDGGHLFFFFIEGIFRREISMKWKEMAQQIGFIILISLMIFVFMIDIDRLNIGFIKDFLKMFNK